MLEELRQRPRALKSLKYFSAGVLEKCSTVERCPVGLLGGSGPRQRGPLLVLGHMC